MTTFRKIAVFISTGWLLLVPLSAQTKSVSKEQSLHIN
jgi:hypothetical protein